jgi:hypothetical protein
MLAVTIIVGSIGCIAGLLLLRSARSPVQANRAAALFLTGAVLLAIGGAILLGVSIRAAFARDDGRFANSPLKGWFDKLASGKGLCCSFADGLAIEDVDWDVRPAKVVDADGRQQIEGVHYWVRLDGHWIEVPDAAVVTVPNLFKRPVVWPYVDGGGKTQIRCFMPGSGA